MAEAHTKETSDGFLAFGTLKNRPDFQRRFPRPSAAMPALSFRCQTRRGEAEGNAWLYGARKKAGNAAPATALKGACAKLARLTLAVISGRDGMDYVASWAAGGATDRFPSNKAGNGFRPKLWYSAMEKQRTDLKK